MNSKIDCFDCEVVVKEGGAPLCAAATCETADPAGECCAECRQAVQRMLSALDTADGDQDEIAAINAHRTSHCTHTKCGHNH